VGVDETRDQEVARVIDNIGAGRQRLHNLSPVDGAHDAAVLHDERTVRVIDVRTLSGDRRIVEEMEDLPAVHREPGRAVVRSRTGRRGQGHRVFALCATHAATSPRSSVDICVRLPIGMYPFPTVSPIFAAWPAICSGVSSTMPFGGCAKPSCLGWVAWHGTHRAAITRCTSAKATGAEAGAAPRGASAQAPPAAVAHAATGSHGLTAPLCRSTKNWRISTPASISAASTAQP